MGKYIKMQRRIRTTLLLNKRATIGNRIFAYLSSITSRHGCSMSLKYSAPRLSTLAVFMAIQATLT